MNAPTIISVLTAAESASIAVGAGLTVYTKAIDLSNVDQFALSYKVACTGVPNIKIEMEQSVVKPTTEGAADANFVVPETIADVDASLTDEDVHIKALSPVCVQFIRFKITEVTGVVADSVLTMNLSVQNRFRQ
ncbi:MAG: hypothetical protein WC481_08650 [Candidatus Omnitrophota bacterium]